jgi:prepilin signal peptidase PulO-like enzyme (type II secretory pathway)
MSAQYISVETITGFVFLFTALRIFENFTDFSFIKCIYFGLFTVLFSLVIVMSTYDIKHFILPWKTMKFFIFFSIVIFLLNIFITQDYSFNTIFGFILVPLPFFLLWYFSKGRLIGFGDIELMLGAGFLFGTMGGFVSVILSFWIAMIYVIYLYIKNKKITGKSMIPFGPFIGLGIFVYFLYSDFILKFIFPFLG